MLTRKRWAAPTIPQGLDRDVEKYLRELNKSISDYLLSLEAPDSLTITEASIDATTGAFTTLGVGLGAGVAPGVTIDAKCASATATVLRLQNGDGSTNNVQMRFRGANAAADQWAIGNAVATNDASRNFDIFDLVSGANRLRIDASGDVGIGSGTPDSLLHVGYGSVSGRSNGVQLSKDYTSYIYNNSSDNSLVLDANGDCDYRASLTTNDGQGRIIFKVARGSALSPAGSNASYEALRIESDGRLYGTALHNNASAVSGTTNQYIASGTYTPAAYNNKTNIASESRRQLTWIRVGNAFTISGIVQATPTAATTATSLTIDWPSAFSSAFSTVYQAGGTGAYIESSVVYPVAITADATNDQLKFTWYPTSTNASIIAFTVSGEIV